MRIFITSLYINAQNLTEHSVDEIIHHVHHKGQSREFTLDKLRQRSYSIIKSHVFFLSQIQKLSKVSNL